MAIIEEFDADEAPGPVQVPGAEHSGRISGCAGCEGLHICSELAFEGGTNVLSKSTRVLSFGEFLLDDSSDVLGPNMVYHRAENGALITHLRAACTFISAGLSNNGGEVAVVSEAEGEAGAAFLIASFLILVKKLDTEKAVDAVLRARPMNGLSDHPEFMKNLRFLGRNGLPDWA